jgi:signal transduction histidine kinase
MDTQSTEERIKPFRLVKYFTFTGLVVIFLVTVILSVLNTHWVRTIQLQKSEDYAHVLIENLNHQIFIRFVLPVGRHYGELKLSNRLVFERMDNVVRSTMHSFKVEALNIYSPKNVITYSFDRDIIGRKNFGGTGFEQAKAGKSTSKLIQRGNFFQIMLGFPKEIRLVTFAPLLWEEPLGRRTDDLVGIIEIVQDISEDYQNIFQVQILFILICTILMGSLFVVLVFVVKRGEGIIEKRALERLRLKERLSRAERLSALGEMAAGISHEIRNPLGIIRSSAELLKKKVSAVDPANSIPDIIVEESTRLNGIITDFINFARPRNPNLRPCRIEDVLEKNITYLDAHIRESDCRIEKRYTNSLPEIMADTDMLYQSFLNILINAMQSMPSGGNIVIGIEANGKMVTVKIDDEGEGIPDELLEKIWDPFFTTKKKGTGLGLGIVKNIIESHGGSILIANREEKGTRVTVELPVSQKAVE